MNRAPTCWQARCRTPSTTAIAQSEGGARAAQGELPTSSRPSSRDAPWHATGSADEDSEARAAVSGDTNGTEDPEEKWIAATSANGVALVAEGKTPASAAAGKRKKAGRRPGAPGHSRQVSLPVSATVIHAPEFCACCDEALDAAEFMARTGLYVLAIEADAGAGLRGLRVRHHKQLYGETTCNHCGHVNRSEPGRCPAEPQWAVAPVSYTHLDVYKRQP